MSAYSKGEIVAVGGGRREDFCLIQLVWYGELRLMRVEVSFGLSVIICLFNL